MKPSDLSNATERRLAETARGQVVRLGDRVRDVRLQTRTPLWMRLTARETARLKRTFGGAA